MTCAKATVVHKREASNAKEASLQLALAAYQEALMSDTLLSVWEAACCFNVSKMTLQAHINGRRRLLETSYNRSWVTDAESKVIVDELICLAEQGFLDSKRHLCGRVNAIIQEKLGDPSFNVGEKWVDRWLQRWGKWLSTYWSTSLDTVRARALNPHVVHDYFQKVKKTLSEYSIEPDCLWTMDEMRCAFGQAGKIMVIGQAGKQVQHSQQDGNWETATLMPLISAAGVCMLPCVIFKGKKMNSIWLEPVNNPLGCLIQMSIKGYSSHIIG